MNMKFPIYMDYNATTPLDKRVLDAMMPYFTEHFGNPHSRSHEFGWNAENAIEEARKIIAKSINADPKEIIFTSGATESNNLAIKGVAYFNKTENKNHIITLGTEHKCVLDSVRNLEMEGFEITYLQVDQNGLINLDSLRKAIRPETILVSITAVNSEIGVIQDIEAIGKICRSEGILFHTDAAQAFGKMRLDVNQMNIDLMSISGHKIYGPKGIGALYVRRKPRVRLKALISGGGQERGMRSGTLATPLIVGLGKATQLCYDNLEEEIGRIKILTERMYNKITSSLEHIYLNGDKEKRVAGNLNLSFSCVEGESMIMAIKELAVSSGSACTSSSLESSYVLRELGVDEEMSHTSIRFGIGRFTTEEEIDYACEVIIRATNKLRNMSPLWDMVKAGIDLKQVIWTHH